jgi:hypothetical protein
MSKRGFRRRRRRRRRRKWVMEYPLCTAAAD